MRCSLRSPACLLLLFTLAQGCLLAPVPLTAEQSRPSVEAGPSQDEVVINPSCTGFGSR